MEKVSVIFTCRVLCNIHGFAAHNPDSYFLQFFSGSTEEYFFAVHHYPSHKGMLGLILTTTVTLRGRFQ